MQLFLLTLCTLRLTVPSDRNQVNNVISTSEDFQGLRQLLSGMAPTQAPQNPMSSPPFAGVLYTCTLSIANQCMYTVDRLRS